MADTLIVTRWVRFGHDRLYVKAADGTQIGYRDNKTGEDHLEASGHRETLLTALTAYWAGGGRPAPLPSAETTAERTLGAAPVAEPAASAALPELVAPRSERPWTDLSLVRPGAAARDQALAKRAEAPVRTLFARVLGVHTDERAWRIGADGEELVAAELQRLGPAWKALHAVPVGTRGSDIDHVLIGPGGVYTINTKHHPGANIWVGGNTVMINGSKTHYVRDSRYEARRATDLLTARVGFAVHVTGLIAMIGDRDKFTLKSQPPGGDVHVLTRRKVADWLSHRGTVLSSEQVDGVFDIARRSTTWTG
jgi:Nuclease-related domain